MSTAVNVVNMMIPLAISLSLLLFPVGIILAIVIGQSSNKRKTFWVVTCLAGPIILLFAFTSLWGFVNILSKTLVQ